MWSSRSEKYHLFAVKKAHFTSVLSHGFILLLQVFAAFFSWGTNMCLCNNTLSLAAKYFYHFYGNFFFFYKVFFTITMLWWRMRAWSRIFRCQHPDPQRFLSLSVSVGLSFSFYIILYINKQISILSLFVMYFAHTVISECTRFGNVRYFHCNWLILRQNVA